MLTFALSILGSIQDDIIILDTVLMILSPKYHPPLQLQQFQEPTDTVE
jgi:hypothetical protein